MVYIPLHPMTATPRDWTLLAQQDDGQPYEVDITEIYRTPAGGYVLVTASGCSCWESSEYDEAHFETLDALFTSLRTTDQPRWNPSFSGVDALIREAGQTLVALGLMVEGEYTRIN